MSSIGGGEDDDDDEAEEKTLWTRWWKAVHAIRLKPARGLASRDRQCLNATSTPTGPLAPMIASGHDYVTMTAPLLLHSPCSLFLNNFFTLHSAFLSSI